MRHLVTGRHLEIARWTLPCLPLPRADASHTLRRMRFERRRGVGYGGEIGSPPKPASPHSRLRSPRKTRMQGDSSRVSATTRPSHYPLHLCTACPPPFGTAGIQKRKKSTNTRCPHKHPREGGGGGRSDLKGKTRTTNAAVTVPSPNSLPQHGCPFHHPSPPSPPAETGNPGRGLSQDDRTRWADDCRPQLRHPSSQRQGCPALQRV